MRGERLRRNRGSTRWEKGKDRNKLGRRDVLKHGAYTGVQRPRHGTYCHHTHRTRPPTTTNPDASRQHHGRRFRQRHHETKEIKSHGHALALAQMPHKTKTMFSLLSARQRESCRPVQQTPHTSPPGRHDAKVPAPHRTFSPRGHTPYCTRVCQFSHT